MEHPLDEYPSQYSQYYGTPNLMGLKFRAWCSDKRTEWQGRYFVEFPTDLPRQDYSLPTWIVMSVLDNVMEWWNLRSIQFVANESRQCDSAWHDGPNGVVKFVSRLDNGYCLFEKKLERSR